MTIEERYESNLKHHEYQPIVAAILTLAEVIQESSKTPSVITINGQPAHLVAPPYQVVPDVWDTYVGGVKEGEDA